MFSQINCLYNVESISEAENGHSRKEVAPCSGETGLGDV